MVPRPEPNIGPEGYAPMSTGLVLDEIAMSLAVLKVPDLTDIPAPLRLQALRRLQDGGNAGAMTRESLKSKVAVFSRGMTTLADTDTAAVSPRRKEWNTVYFELIGLFSSRIVAIGQAAPQVEFLTVA